MNKRPSWDEYFLQMADMVAARSTCLRRAVGAVIVKDKRILATGYNGAPRNVPHCTDDTCIRKKLNIPSGERHELCRGVHAEQNAIIQAAYYGVSINGSDIYITTQPCIICTKMLINSGVKRFVYKNPYNDVMALEMIKEAGIDCLVMQ